MFLIHKISLEIQPDIVVIVALAHFYGTRAEIEHESALIAVKAVIERVVYLVPVYGAENLARFHSRLCRGRTGRH